jgi:hypothetical protein
MATPENENPEQETSLFRKTISSVIGCLAVIITGDPDGFDTRKK